MFVDKVASWVGSYPLRTSGGSAALLSGGVMWRTLDVSVGPTGVTAARTTPEGLLAFFAAHPAYLAAFLLGLAVFAFVRA